ASGSPRSRRTQARRAFVKARLRCTARSVASVAAACSNFASASPKRPISYRAIPSLLSRPTSRRAEVSKTLAESSGRTVRAGGMRPGETSTSDWTCSGGRWLPCQKSHSVRPAAVVTMESRMTRRIRGRRCATQASFSGFACFRPLDELDAKGVEHLLQQRVLLRREVALCLGFQHRQDVDDLLGLGEA